MKTTIFRRKTPAFFGAAAVLLAAVFTIGCKTEISSDPAPETFTVEMKAGEHGTLSANPVIPAGGTVAKDKVITFTADPASGYKVDKWTITGGTFESGTGTEGSLTAKLKISADTKVDVSFKAIAYNTVSFADLDTYLKDTASSADINYIEVTGLTAANLEGRYEYNLYSYKPSALGKILNDNQTKKVALKLGEISGLTDMRYCFLGCTSLTQAPVIPSTVTYMNGCFSGCTSLTQAPEIPSGVTDMTYCFYGCEKITAVTLKCNYNSEQIYGFHAFQHAFQYCEKLTAGSIKVPSGQLQTYKDNADTMGAQKEWFVAE